MARIGLLSDTHSFLDPQVFKYFENCDEIWHGGDIGNLEVIDQLQTFRPTKAVHGNIDGREISSRYPEDLRFTCEGLRVWITHIGGYPPRYNKRVKALLQEEPPNILICGHSHILKVMTDPELNNMLYLNPGAAGLQGFHKVKTLIRFEINNSKVSNMEVIELGKRG